MNKYLTVKRIEFVVTYLCNSKCRHCQLGEEKERRSFPSHIDKDIAVEIVRKVGMKYRPKSVMTFGGEPLLYPGVVYAIHKEATRMRIPVRDVITNGFWSRKVGEIEEIADNLAKSGVTEVSISVDAFHQEFVPLKTVKKAAESLLRAGIAHVSWNPCWVICKDNDSPYNKKTRAILKELESELPIAESSGNVAQPEGRALFWLKDFLPQKVRIPEEKCGDMPYTELLNRVKTISVEPDGRVAVCKDFHIGNAYERDIIDIIENYDPFSIPEAKAIVEGGVDGLMNWGKAKGIKPDPTGYYNVCDMCRDIREKAEQKQLVKESSRKPIRKNT
jgi:MoaA/NifB/PqqE/SkfB family radical SAM enzyme